MTVPARKTSSIPEELSDEQLALVMGLANGETTAQIGERLNMTPDTVKYRVQLMYRDFKVRGSDHLVAICYRNGLLDEFPPSDYETGRFERESPVVFDVAKVACEIVDDTAPALLSLHRAAALTAGIVGKSPKTVVRYLREALAARMLIAVRPDMEWRVMLPGMLGQTKTVVRVIEETVRLDQFFQEKRLILSSDPRASIRDGAGPGETMYLVTPKRAHEFVTQLIKDDKAASDRRAAELAMARNLEQAEIDSRTPGFLIEVRRIGLVLNSLSADCPTGRTETGLYAGEHDEIPLEERELFLNIHASGAHAVVLGEIIQAGMRAYLANQRVVRCIYCRERILYHGAKDFWWHHLSTAIRCPKGATRATPPPAQQRGALAP